MKKWRCIVESERTINVCISAQLYRRRNHASQAIPSPEATLLVATALRAYESTLNIESGDIEKTAVFTLYEIISAYFYNQQVAYAARATSWDGLQLGCVQKQKKKRSVPIHQ